eukprot:GHVO01047965.1.p1 GENE.GHVO01047965.1~~GHVO01047965.1.p1  ORF type:complete len:202 (+),score=35.49 GHVO01047965.1:89-694(+)
MEMACIDNGMIGNSVAGENIKKLVDGLSSRIIMDTANTPSDEDMVDVTDQVEMEYDRVGIRNLGQTLAVPRTVVIDIIKGLTLPIAYSDIRREMDPPCMFGDMITINSISIGYKCLGQVTNTTTFGAFVDIGLDVQGLLHTSKMKHRGSSKRFGDVAFDQHIKEIDVLGSNDDVGLRVGDTVMVRVTDTDLKRNRIGLCEE